MNNEAVTKARLLQWMKNVLPLVKSNAFKYNKTFDLYMLNELEVLAELITNENEETVTIPDGVDGYGPYNYAEPLDYTILRDYYVEREGCRNEPF